MPAPIRCVDPARLVWDHDHSTSTDVFREDRSPGCRGPLGGRECGEIRVQGRLNIRYPIDGEILLPRRNTNFPINGVTGVEGPCAAGKHRIAPQNARPDAPTTRGSATRPARARDAASVATANAKRRLRSHHRPTNGASERSRRPETTPPRSYGGSIFAATAKRRLHLRGGARQRPQQRAQNDPAGSARFYGTLRGLAGSGEPTIAVVRPSRRRRRPHPGSWTRRAGSRSRTSRRCCSPRRH